MSVMLSPGKLWAQFRSSALGKKLRRLFPNQIVNTFKHLPLAFLAVLYYRYPARQLTVIGVTGTDGKTTTVNLINHLLTTAGFKTGMISTVGAKIGRRKIKTGFHVTTPNPWKIQALMRSMVDQGVKFLVLEATSMGLVQHRLLGCRFQIGVITNVTHEHLDYHRTYQNYLKAKAKLFARVKYAVLNRDDRSYSYLAARLKKKRRVKIVTYGLIKPADLTPKTFPFQTKLLGKFNQSNCLAAIAVAQILQIPDRVIRKALLSFKPVKGRLEEIKTGQNFRVLVDFAHTPHAFEVVIPAVRRITPGRIIHVFGCTGSRDPSKRPLMGEIAARLSDKIILTHEDTYFENPDQIIAAIERGVKKEGKVLNRDYWLVPDRKKAIRKAVGMARSGDTVLITGVGHQTTLNLGGREVPWSDQKEVRAALKELNA